MAKQKGDVITGTVVEALPNTMFRVRVIFENLPQKYRDDITKKELEIQLKADRYAALTAEKVEEDLEVSEGDEALTETQEVKRKEFTQIIAYLAGKMKYHRIKVIVGDTVEVLLDPYGGKGRVVRRR